MGGSSAGLRVLLILLSLLLAAGTLAGQDDAHDNGPTADFEAVWDAVRDSYFDSEFDPANWDALRQAYRGRVQDAQDDESAYRIISEMLGELDNDDVFLIPPSDVPELLAGPAEGPEEEYAGVGILIAEREDGSVVATGTFRDAPAEQAGVLPGDVIVAVDGEALPEEDATDTAVERIRGPVGTEVTLTLRAPDGEIRDIVITRGRIDLRPSVDARIERPGIGYLRIPMLTVELVQEASRAFPRLLGAEGIVLDLRAVRGGAPEAAVILAQWFLGPAEIATVVTREESFPLPHRPDAIAAYRRHLVIITDDRTSGMGEVLAAVLREYGRATVVGGGTAGASQIGSFLPLPSGGMLHLVVGQYQTPEGRMVGREPVAPDVEVEPPDLQAIRAGDDPYLDRAEQIIREGGRR